VAWEETLSDHFAARHAENDARDARAVLGVLEDMRARLEDLLPSDVLPAHEVAVVLHGSPAQLHFAQPLLPLVTHRTAPAGRRYVGGRTVGGDTIHMPTPRLLKARATKVEGSRELLRLVPAALYGRIVVTTLNPRIAGWRGRRWTWLGIGTAEWLAGRTRHARGAIGRRLHEGQAPAFPPAPADALLLGGTIVDLLAREEGVEAVFDLVRGAAREWKRPEDALQAAFHGRPLHQTEGTWRGGLAKVRDRERAARDA